MDAAEIPLKAPSIPTDIPTSDVEQIERALIDASTRVPVLMFYTSAIAWLLIGTLLAGFGIAAFGAQATTGAMAAVLVLLALAVARFAPEAVALE